MEKYNRPSRSRRWASEHTNQAVAGATGAPTDSFTAIWVGNRVVGEVIGDTFIKRVRASIHFLRTPRAIAFDVESLNQAQHAGARVVKVVDIETGKIYQAWLSTIWSKGFELDRGYGRQQALALSEWSLDSSPLAEQLCFWQP